MKTLKPISLIGMVLLLIAGACENLPVPELETSDSSPLKCYVPPECCELKLFAGQDEFVGTLDITCDGELLFVTYLMEVGWCLTETHLDVAGSLAGIPQTKKGNPIPGKFADKDEHDCVSNFTYSIDVSSLGCEGLIIAAHAVVKEKCTRRMETAWGSLCGKSESFPGSSWATYIEYTPCE